VAEPDGSAFSESSEPASPEQAEMARLREMSHLVPIMLRNYAFANTNDFDSTLL
jgi:hypothetical protein